MDSHYKEKIVSQPSMVTMWIPIPGKIIFLLKWYPEPWLVERLKKARTCDTAVFILEHITVQLHSRILGHNSPNNDCKLIQSARYHLFPRSTQPTPHQRPLLAACLTLTIHTWGPLHQTSLHQYREFHGLLWHKDYQECLFATIRTSILMRQNLYPVRRDPVHNSYNCI